MYSSCDVRPFGDKAGLARHYREVHSSKVYYCPFRSCYRHKNGFARRYNLLQHQTHCHGDNPLSRLRKSSESLLEHDDELTELGRSPSEEIDRDSETQSVVEASSAHSGAEDRLERKLRDLKAKRDRLNREIATLERAQALVGANPS